MCFFVLFLLPSSNPQKTGNGTHRSLFPFLYPFICLFLHGRHNALCQTGKALNFRRNDDLGGLTVGSLGERLQRFQLNHCVTGVGVIEQANGVCGGLLHRLNSRSLTLGLANFRFFSASA